MQVQDFSRLIKLASGTEKTPELQAYWQKQYQIILESASFVLNSKTLELFKQDEIINTPVTPLGEIFLQKHVDSKSLILDEEALRETVFAAVRFLDSLVSRLNFSQEVRFIVEQYRKIGLGVADFNDYLKRIGSESKTDEIDFVGGLVSEAAYRASEMLAEEKGFCGKWDKIKKHLRPKAFENWYNTETEEIKDGLDLYETMDQEQIEISNWEIVPRRNSHILVFPPDQPWQLWSDRDQHAPKTEITSLDERIKEEKISQDIKQNEKKFTVPKEQTPVVKKDPEFSIGELVTVQKSASPHNGKVYQVFDQKEINNECFYSLEGGNEEITKIMWSENDLAPVDLTEILQKINRPQLPPKQADSENLFALRSSVLIFNKDKNKVLLENSDLPFIELTKKDRPEFLLADDVKANWGVELEIIDEIGTATNAEDKLYLVFEGVVNESLKPVLKSKNRNFKWVDIGEQGLLPHVRLILDKYIYKKM